MASVYYGTVPGLSRDCPKRVVLYSLPPQPHRTASENTPPEELPIDDQTPSSIPPLQAVQKLRAGENVRAYLRAIRDCPCAFADIQLSNA